MANNGNLFTFNRFIKGFAKGYARPNRYLVTFRLPPGISGAGGSEARYFKESLSGAINKVDEGLNGSKAEIPEIINMFCHTCSFPERTVQTFDFKSIAGSYRIPYTQVYQPITFSFYANSEMNTRQYFDVWQTAVVNIIDSSVNFYDEFKSDITITQYDIEGKPTYQVRLDEAYPITLGQTDLSYSNDNTIQTVTVTMSFKFWERTLPKIEGGGRGPTSTGGDVRR